jgi:hypothetical protein
MRSPFQGGLARWLLAVLPSALCLPVFAQGPSDARLALNERAYLASRVYASLANSAHVRDVPRAKVFPLVCSIRRAMP